MRVAVAADVGAFRAGVHASPLGGIVGEHVGFAEPIGAAEKAPLGDLQSLDGIALWAHGDPEQPIGSGLNELRRLSQGTAGHSDEQY